MKEREGKPGMRFQNSLINFQFSIKNSLRNRTGFQNFSFFPFGSDKLVFSSFFFYNCVPIEDWALVRAHNKEKREWKRSSLPNDVPLSFLFIMEFWWPINGVRWKRALRADTIGHQWTHEKEREALEQENFLYVTGYLMAGSWESSSKAFGPAINRLQENSQGFQLPGLKKRKSFTLIAHSFLLLWGDRERFLFNHGKLRSAVKRREKGRSDHLCHLLAFNNLGQHWKMTRSLLFFTLAWPSIEADM